MKIRIMTWRVNEYRVQYRYFDSTNPLWSYLGMYEVVLDRKTFFPA